MKDRRRDEITRVLNGVRGGPMEKWPPEVFGRLGMMDPFNTGNIMFWLEGLKETAQLSGAVVECGTYRAESLAPLAWILREGGDKRPIFGLDSFQGFPTPGNEDLWEGEYRGRGDLFTRTSFEEVSDYMDALGLADQVTLVRGYFKETLPGFPSEAISFLILDCDLHESYKTCLEHLYERVQHGGWIVFDEYYSPKYPGARIAVDEFFADKPEKPRLAAHRLEKDPYERWYVVKAPMETGT